MTNLEALKARVSYPLPENTFILALQDRSLTAADAYVSASKRSLELAYADVLMSILSAPQSVSEGGYSISTGDRAMLVNIANRIYSKYGDAAVANTPSPTATFVHRW